MDKKIVLRVNGEDVKMNNFVKKIIIDVNRSIITNLKLEDKKVKTIEIKITPE